MVIKSIEEGRKEDGNRSIADKIIKRLHDLEKTVENNQGRWAWELLQNAKDSIAEDEDRTVSVQIELNDNSVEFRHNGTHFTERDIRGLINQISSKEVEEGQQTQKTGRFGTGFLTTHLLSRSIQVKGIVETASDEYYSFKFLLDRQGKTTHQLIPKIENSWQEFHQFARKLNVPYEKEQFNTSFCYYLETEKQKAIAKIGVEEFSRLIHFVLAFIPKISKIEIIDNTTQTKIVFKNDYLSKEEPIKVILKEQNGETTKILILFHSNDKVAIATEIEENPKGYSLKDIREIPKLFCDFPLIGTEDFHFPVVVNSFFFNPQTEREGIWLNGNDDIEVQENQALLKSAVELYRELLDNIAQKNFFDLYNIAETRMPSTNEKYFDGTWYKNFIQEPIRELVWNAKLVELENENLEKRSIGEIFFPKEALPCNIREKLWQFIFDISPNIVCKKAHIHKWCDISWKDWKKIDYNALIQRIAEQENLEKLSQVLKKDERKTFEWLNSVGDFISEDLSNLHLLENSTIVPNKNGGFQCLNALYTDEVQDKDLLDVLVLLGEDWKDILLHDKICLKNYNFKRSKTKRDIANKITEKINKYKHYISDSNLAKAISILSEWFDNNPESGKELFADLYNKRAELFMNTISDKESLYKIMRSCDNPSKLAEVAKALESDSNIINNTRLAEQLTDLLKEFNAEDISDLKKMLLSSKQTFADSPKIPITQETLLSLGVTSIEDLEEALKEKDFSAQFIHTSTPTVEMLVRVQKLIQRAKDNVIEFLKKLPEYDCNELEELAVTVFGGIKKNGVSIYIVVRPSDNGEVIIYYEAEKDALDYSDAELWIDNGKDSPKRLNLGKILKTTGINRIPI